jgi:GxxExxY protein
MNELLHGDITRKIIGCAFEVHNFLGRGFVEVVYQRALALEMIEAGLHFSREIDQPIFYKNHVDDIGSRRADFVVQEKVLIETKAHSELTDADISQVLNCLKVHHFEVGLLINFGAKSMEFKRLILTDANS